MSTMLASDLNNPEFVGAVNPDALLFVEFYWHTPVDKWGSEEASVAAGRRVVVNMKKMKVEPNGKATKTDEDLKLPYIRIMKPGDQTSIVETAVREDHKQRWPQQWLYWQMAEGLVDDGAGIPGWKIDDWTHLDGQPTLLRDLKYMRFYTVEMIAGASDAQVQKMGIGGAGLRQQAAHDLRGKLAKTLNADIAARDAQIADQAAAIKKMQDDMAILMEQATKPKGK
jgi:hypothetical protein